MIESNPVYFFSSEVVDRKIEEFLLCFEEKLKSLTEEAYNTQVTYKKILKTCDVCL